MGLFEIESNKILSRKSSVGCSSRISYYRSGEGVPFKWEMQPGIAKESSPAKELLPLTPPPKFHSSGLAKPCILDSKKSPSTMSKLKLWKKRVIKIKSRKPQEDCFHQDFDALSWLDCSSDSESMASPRGSSFSSSSSSMSTMKSTHSSLNSVYSCSERTVKPVFGGCFPMNMSRVLVSITRRN
ncbi:uncharacterized protein LOC131628577 [Vicia villosa]|uniref:uncharacterized protein LOC131628577 n=1 Tax=Vicia villosa TaxID=3911 RepID=UPI00273C27F9|nr:uncharacterized protein LOC131628577 [Vicia villosa]